MYVMKPRDISTAPRWKLKPCQTKRVQILNRGTKAVQSLRYCIQQFHIDTHMQEGTGCVRRHDGRESAKPESALENICGMRASRCLRGGVRRNEMQFFRTESKQARSSCGHKAKALCEITHRCAGSWTWADSTTSPPPPSTEETQYWAV